jgi:predicted TIM-barrel fold metal-dependent hydrolase
MVSHASSEQAATPHASTQHAPIGHPVISADGHVDLPLLPADLFTARVPAALRDRVPHVVQVDGVSQWVDGDGALLAGVGGTSHTGSPYVKGQSARFDRMNESGFWDDVASGIMHPADPALRLAAQDRDGIVGEVVYGILGAANAIRDPEIQVAVMAAYNDWLVEFCAAADGRIVGVACLPSGNPDAAAAELRRLAARGQLAVEVAMTHDLLPLWRQEFAPIWQAADETGAIVHLHTIGPPIDPRHATNARERASWVGAWLTVFQLRMIDRLAELTFGGVLHAHPNMRVVLGESGIGWLPYVLDRMDEEWHERFTHLELTMPPSDYYRRQMFATFQRDEAGLLLADRIGVHTLMWGNDFPHGDGVWPDSRSVIDKQFAEVSADTRQAICLDNAARLYGFAV